MVFAAMVTIISCWSTFVDPAQMPAATYAALVVANNSLPSVLPIVVVQSK